MLLIGAILGAIVTYVCVGLRQFYYRPIIRVSSSVSKFRRKYRIKVRNEGRAGWIDVRFSCFLVHTERGGRQYEKIPLDKEEIPLITKAWVVLLKDGEIEEMIEEGTQILFVIRGTNEKTQGRFAKRYRLDRVIEGPFEKGSCRIKKLPEKVRP